MRNVRKAEQKTAQTIDTDPKSAGCWKRLHPADRSLYNGVIDSVLSLSLSQELADFGTLGQVAFHFQQTAKEKLVEADGALCHPQQMVKAGGSAPPG